MAAEASVAPDVLVEKVETQRAVAEAVIRLPEPLRSALILRYYVELPVREVARTLGISPKVAESRIRRGLEALRGDFVHRFGAHWTAALTPLLELLPAAATAAAVGTAIVTTQTKLLVAGACALVLLSVYATFYSFGGGGAGVGTRGRGRRRGPGGRRCARSRAHRPAGAGGLVVT